MNKKYVVKLEESERSRLTEIVHKGKHSARKRLHAQLLPLADEGMRDAAIAHTLRIGLSTVERTRRKLVEEGLEAALVEMPRSGRPPRSDAKAEATLVVTACGSPPEGRTHWTMKLLADKLVELGVVESLSPETVRLALLKKRSSRGSRNSG
jgi:transposase